MMLFAVLLLSFCLLPTSAEGSPDLESVFSEEGLTFPLSTPNNQSGMGISQRGLLFGRDCAQGWGVCRKSIRVALSFPQVDML